MNDHVAVESVELGVGDSDCGLGGSPVESSDLLSGGGIKFGKSSLVVAVAFCNPTKHSESPHLAVVKDGSVSTELDVFEPCSVSLGVAGIGHGVDSLPSVMDGENVVSSLGAFVEIVSIGMSSNNSEGITIHTKFGDTFSKLCFGNVASAATPDSGLFLWRLSSALVVHHSIVESVEFDHGDLAVSTSEVVSVGPSSG